MQWHPCLPEITKRYAALDSQVRRGSLSVTDAVSRYASIVKDGTLGMANLGASIPTEADDSDFSIPFVITVLEEDRDGDIVFPLGCQLGNFKHNPIFMWGHQQYQNLPFPIGKLKSPDGRITVYPEENRIKAVVYFDRNDEDAMVIYRKYKEGFLNAVSVAFVPIEAYRRDREAEKGVYENRAHTHSQSMTPAGWMFKAWDMTELSGVCVPANAGAIADWLATDKHLSPRIRKSFVPYAAKALMRSFSGWCPPGTVACPDGTCRPVTKAHNPLPGEPDVDEEDDEEDDGEIPTWDAVVDGKAWRSVQAPTECAAKNIVKWEIDAQRRNEMSKDYTEEEFRARFPVPKIGVKGPYKLSKRRAPKAVAKALEFEPIEMPYTEAGCPPRERWNKSLSDAFDAMPELQMGEAEKLGAAATHRVAAKYLGCQIKDLHQASVMVPSPRMGSFLSGLKSVLAGYRTVEVRNLSDRSEQPPVYETLQLNSKLRDTFLVQGTIFMESVAPRGKRANPRQCFKGLGQVGKGSGPHNNYGAGVGDKRFVVKLRPEWGGLNVTVITKRADAALNQDVVDRSWAWAREHNYLKGEAFALSGEFLPRTDEGFGDVFLEEHNKRAVQRTLDLFNKKGLDFANRGVIMCGPPGTGKTLSSRIMRNQAKGTFIWVSSRDFHASGSVGGISMAFEMAKELAPCVLCMEDVDNWLSPTSVDLLKTEMDGISRSKGVLTVLTTNFPEELPDALIDRPGRFHDVLEFKNPTAACRKAMLAKWLPSAPAASIKDAVDKSDGYSGAHVYELAHFAKSLQEHDDMGPAQAVAEALRKVEEQRQLVTALKTNGGSYERRRHRSHHEAFAMKATKAQPATVTKALGQVGKRACACGGTCGKCGVVAKSGYKEDIERVARERFASKVSEDELQTIINQVDAKFDQGHGKPTQIGSMLQTRVNILLDSKRKKSLTKMDIPLPKRSRGGEQLLPTRPVEDIFARMHRALGRDDRVPGLPEWDAWKQAVTEHYVNLRTVEARLHHRRALEQAYNALVGAARRLGLSVQGNMALPLDDGAKALGKQTAKAPRNFARRKESLQDCVSRKIPIFKREHPDWADDHVQAAAYGYCGEKKSVKKTWAVVNDRGMYLNGQGKFGPREHSRVFSTQGEAEQIATKLGAAAIDYWSRDKQLAEASGTAGGYTVPVSAVTDDPSLLAKDVCVECGGSGECTGCDGVGEVNAVPCEVCGGSGECDACAGAGVAEIETLEA